MSLIKEAIFSWKPRHRLDPWSGINLRRLKRMDPDQQRGAVDKLVDVVYRGRAGQNNHTNTGSRARYALNKIINSKKIDPGIRAYVHSSYRRTPRLGRVVEIPQK